jgi:predicted SAM-dependent methyltransferase
VRTVDLMSREELVRAFATLKNVESISAIDVVDDGERLATFTDETLDFVIANHVLEHIEDPIDALVNWLRVLRPGGVLFLTLPDASQSFDSPRRRTSVAHLLRDHREGAAVSRHEHYEEWARLIEGQPEDRVAERVAEYARDGARHHFHVWELGGFVEFVGAAELEFRLEYAQRSIEEFIVVLRRPAAD